MKKEKKIKVGETKIRILHLHAFKRNSFRVIKYPKHRLTYLKTTKACYHGTAYTTQKT